MLHSSYNLNHLGSSTGADHFGNNGLYDSIATNYLPVGVRNGGLGASPPPPQQPPPSSEMLHNLYGSSLPRRRYSIGSLPSQSITEYMHLMQQNADAAHLSSLLNETKTSITRASQILSRGEDITDDIMLSAAAGDLAAPYSRLQHPFTDTDITVANIINQLPVSNNFSSHPNIYYSQPNYHNQTTISSRDYLNRLKKPSAYQLYSRTPYSASATLPSHNLYANQYANTLAYNPQQQPLYGHLTYNKHYSNQPPPPYSSLSLHRPLHYTSNPAISQSSNYYFKHNYNTATAPNSYSHYPMNGYSNQHFDHHYNNCNTKLIDLDYMKPIEHNKRQVSFNVDVDTLSIES